METSKKHLILYHGSDHIIERPEYGAGKVNNDFGPGFYCTEHEELAKEWAVSSYRGGYSNCYSLDMEYYSILNLNSPDYSILNWIATLVAHRLFAIKNPVAGRAKKYLIENFGVNVNAYDVIIGYRADDSYFDYAETFLNNGISVEQLAEAMRLGELGEQVVIKSRYAFSGLNFESYSVAEQEIYYTKRKIRNDDVNKRYLRILERDQDGLYIRDIIRENIKNGDPRIPGSISK